MKKEQLMKYADITESQFYGKEEICDSLYLNSLTKIPKGFNLKVGGWLNLASATEIPEGTIFTAHGVYISSRTYYKRQDPPAILKWENGYTLIDGILCKIISTHGMISKVKIVGHTEVSYVVTDGERYAHGETIKKAKEDLLYKIKDRDTSKYQGLSLDTVFSFTEAIQCYRTITGACVQGTKHFVEQVGKKESYTIEEMLKITEGQFGYETFRKFFKK